MAGQKEKVAETRTDTKPEIKENERLDDLQISGLFIIQDTKRFCFGMDAVLLANYALSAVTGETKLLDLCSGTGIVPILMDARNDCGDYTGLELDDVLRSVAGGLGSKEVEVVFSQFLFVEQDVALLDDVEVYGEYRTALKLYGEGVGGFLTEQTTSLEDGHTIAPMLSVVGRLIQIDHSLGDADKPLALLYRLTIEPSEKVGLTGVVLVYLVDGLKNYLTGIGASDDDIAEHHRTGLHLHSLAFGLKSLTLAGGETEGLVANVGEGYQLRF